MTATLCLSPSLVTSNARNVSAIMIVHQRGARPLSRQPHPVISCQQLTRSGHLERGAELARVSRPSLPLHGQNLPGVDRQKIAVLVGYHNGETGVTALDWSTFDV